jgi:hypothetical protein
MSYNDNDELERKEKEEEEERTARGSERNKGTKEE